MHINKLIGSVAALIAISSCHAEGTKCPASPCTFQQGYELCNQKYSPAYNAQARTDVACSKYLFLTSSFTYWYADQEGLNLAYPTTLIVTPLLPQNSTYLKQDFEYKPGFKVGLGINFDKDDWVGFLEYTWFRSNTSVHKTPPADLRGGTPIWVVNDWFKGGGANYHATDIESHWRLGIDILDATLSRPYYQGRNLTLTPFGGLRTTWIRQNLRVLAPLIEADYNPTVNSHTHSNSWALGPRAGCQCHWVLAWGFRLEGDVAGSLLYTKYTTVAHREDAIDSTLSPIETSVRYKDVSLIRPMADLKLGLGWGGYFSDQRYHFDLLATYDFNVMWGQNQIRALLDEFTSYTGAEAGDLHLQGLTVSARFDF